MEQKRITFSMPIELYEMLKNEAKRTGISISGMINVAVKEYVKTGSVLQLTELYRKEYEK